MGEIAKEFLEKSFQNAFQETNENMSSEIFPTERSQESQNNSSDPSSYALARDHSQMSEDVDVWLRGHPTASAEVQDSRAPLPHSTVPDTYQAQMSNGMWYILALVLPFFTINNYPQWRCSPSALTKHTYKVLNAFVFVPIGATRWCTVINTAELLLGNFGRACDRVRCNLRRLAQNQLSRELFATTMDIILVVYAVGFLILSMYQASMIG